MFYDTKGVKTNSFLYHFVFLYIAPVLLALYWGIYTVFEILPTFAVLVGGIRLAVIHILPYPATRGWSDALYYFLIGFPKLFISCFFYWLEIKKNKGIARTIDTIDGIINFFCGIHLLMRT